MERWPWLLTSISYGDCRHHWQFGAQHFTGLIYDSRMSPYLKTLASFFEGPHTWKLALEEHRPCATRLQHGI